MMDLCPNAACGQKSPALGDDGRCPRCLLTPDEVRHLTAGGLPGVLPRATKREDGGDLLGALLREEGLTLHEEPAPGRGVKVRVSRAPLVGGQEACPTGPSSSDDWTALEAEAAAVARRRARARAAGDPAEIERANADRDANDPRVRLHPFPATPPGSLDATGDSSRLVRAVEDVHDQVIDSTSATARVEAALTEWGDAIVVELRDGLGTTAGGNRRPLLEDIADTLDRIDATLAELTPRPSLKLTAARALVVVSGALFVALAVAWLLMYGPLA